MRKAESQLTILGIVAIVAIIGLVLMLTGKTGFPNGAFVFGTQAVASFGKVSPEVQNAIRNRLDKVEVPITKELSKLFFIDYVGRIHATPLGTDCGPDSTSYKKIRKGIRWLQFPVSYQIDPSNSGIGDVAKQAVVNALNSWDYEEHPIGDFFIEASPAEITIKWDYIDGAGGALAVTSVLFNIITGEILSSSVTFDSGDEWAVYPGLSCEGQGSAFDVENIAAHEIGHAVGLDHVRKSSDVALTMWPYAAQGETHKRTLGKGDKLGVDALY